MTWHTLEKTLLKGLDRALVGDWDTGLIKNLVIAASLAAQRARDDRNEATSDYL